MVPPLVIALYCYVVVMNLSWTGEKDPREWRSTKNGSRSGGEQASRECSGAGEIFPGHSGVVVVYINRFRWRSESQSIPNISTTNQVSSMPTAIGAGWEIWTGLRRPA